MIPIGIPRGAPTAERAGLIGDGVLDLYPHRARDGSKFTSGVVVIAGGGEGLTGAPTMAALAAQRAGAGYVQVAVPKAAQATLELRLLEAMTRGLPDRGRRPHRGGRGGAGRDGRARRRGGAGPGPGPNRGRGGVRARRRRGASRRRC